MKLADFLKAHGLSDEAFATKSGGAFSAEAVRKWRFHVRTPRHAQLLKIMELTDGEVTANDFVRAPEERPAGEAA